MAADPQVLEVALATRSFLTAAPQKQQDMPLVLHPMGSNGHSILQYRFDTRLTFAGPFKPVSAAFTVFLATLPSRIAMPTGKTKLALSYDNHENATKTSVEAGETRPEIDIDSPTERVALVTTEDDQAPVASFARREDPAAAVIELDRPDQESHSVDSRAKKDMAGDAHAINCVGGFVAGFGLQVGPPAALDCSRGIDTGNHSRKTSTR